MSCVESGNALHLSSEGTVIGPKEPKQTSADERWARAAVKERDQGMCVRCGRPGGNFDHRVNRSQGGRWAASNGQTLCGSGTTGCHGWVTNHPASAIQDGFAVPGYAHPEVWPAYRIHVGWVVYFDDPVDGAWWRQITESTAEFIMSNGGN